MVEIICLLFGFGLGFVYAREKFTDHTTPAGTLLVYTTSKNEMKLGRLAQDLGEKDKLAIVDAVNDNDKFLSFVINREKVRFYTNNGERINEANWETLK